MSSLKTLDGILQRRVELLDIGAETRESTVANLKNLVKEYSCRFVVFLDENPSLSHKLTLEELFDKFLENE